MRIVLLNGSPKTGKNNSQYFLDTLEKIIKPGPVHDSEAEHSIVHIRLGREKDILNDPDAIKSLTGCETLVIGFPLYVDGIPSHLLRNLEKMEDLFKRMPHKPHVYGIVNNGFYEGVQCTLALQMLGHWCMHCQLNWYGGLGIGSGEMLGNLDSVPPGHGPKKSFGTGMNTLAGAIISGTALEPIFITPEFPRFLYSFMGNLGWKVTARQNKVSLRKQY
ncbi:MAG: NAD(P)H-dependent oxidoreductase [Treponema sp.]|jgi:multimeric flavodoxin WrbA|nr:NAD(P)H-dependent oxidoreductase [Treponema sp.]